MLDEQQVETTLYSLGTGVPVPRERRTGERHLSLLRVGALMIDGRRELCLIKNISAGGMLIRVYSKIAVGTKLSVELKQEEAIDGVARWAEEECVGVSFDSPIDVLELIGNSNDGLRPRMPRIEVQCSAWVRADAMVHRVKTSNISQGGIRVDTAADLPLGADVIVSLVGLSPEPGVVRWKDGSAYGITFNRVLALSQLVAWLQEQQERPRARRRSLT